MIADCRSMLVDKSRTHVVGHVSNSVVDVERIRIKGVPIAGEWQINVRLSDWHLSGGTGGRIG